MGESFIKVFDLEDEIVNQRRKIISHTLRFSLTVVHRVRLCNYLEKGLNDILFFDLQFIAYLFFDLQFFAYPRCHSWERIFVFFFFYFLITLKIFLR